MVVVAVKVAVVLVVVVAVKVAVVLVVVAAVTEKSSGSIGSSNSKKWW